MGLTQKFKDDMAQAYRKNLDVPCFRCNSWKHKFQGCEETNKDKCWVNGHGGLEQKLPSKVDGNSSIEELKNEADAEWRRIKGRQKAKDEAKQAPDKETETVPPHLVNPKPARGKPSTLSGPVSSIGLATNSTLLGRTRPRVVDTLADVEKTPNIRKFPGLRETEPKYFPQQVNLSKAIPVSQRSSSAQHTGTAIPSGNVLSRQDRTPTNATYKFWGVRERPIKPGPINPGLLFSAATSSIGNATNVPRVITNYVHIQSIPDQLYIYTFSNSYVHVKDDGTFENRQLNRSSELQYIFDEARPLFLDSILQSVAWATDFRKIWTNIPLENHPFPHTHTMSYTTTSGKVINQLNLVVEFNSTISNIRSNLQNNRVYDSSEILSALNAIIMRPLRDPQTDYDITQVGSNRLFINEGFASLARLRAVRGYFTSVRPGQNTTLLNVNTATSAFFPPCRVSDILYYVNHDDNVYKDLDLEEVEKWLKGVTVRVAHTRQQPPNRQGNINDEKNRLKTFKNFGRTLADQLFYNFQNPHDHGKSVWDYFTQDLGITGLNKDGRCVNVGKPLNKRWDMRTQSTNGAIWVPAQLLEIKPYQPMRAQLRGELTSQMIRVALREPAHNAQLIAQEGLAVLQLQTPRPTPYMDDFNIGNSLIDIPADFRAAPTLRYRKFNIISRQYLVYDIPVRNAAWNLVDLKFFQAGEISKLNVFNFENAVFAQREEHLRRDMTARLRFHGCNVAEGALSRGSMDDFNRICSRPDGPILVAIPSNDENNYAGIKRIADLKYGIQTVCVIARNIRYFAAGSKPGNQTHAAYENQRLDNLAMKFNIKSRNGYNHVLNPDLLAQLLGAEKDTTVVVGADVGHPPAGSYPGVPSIASVVASYDNQLMNYPGSMRLQPGGQELIDDMEEMVLERLNAWCKNTVNRQRFPTSILFYRDGISESQFRDCIRQEVLAIRRAFNRLASMKRKIDAQIKITFVIAGKRHHTRFYPKEQNQTYRLGKNVNGNVKPGLLVDKVITTPNSYNFYLQSHAAIKGTARSAHYHILADDANYQARGTVLADLTHALCYCFPRATRGVSYVAPAYIADQLCERGRLYMKFWRPDHNFKLQPRDDKKRWTRDLVDQFKRNKVDEVARNPDIWGPHYGNPEPNDPNRPLRKNPWHPNLDDTMFWM